MSKTNKSRLPDMNNSLMPFGRYHTSGGFGQFQELLSLLRTNPTAKNELRATGEVFEEKPLMLLPDHLDPYLMDCSFEFFTAESSANSGELVPTLQSYGCKQLTADGYTLSLIPPKEKGCHSTICVDMGDYRLVI